MISFDAHPRWVALVCGFLGLAAVTLAEPAVAFEKNASQYCFASLSSEQQSQLFSRMMNLGASYSHGCTACDSSEVLRNQLIAAGDQHFVRRNFLAQFLSRADWKDPKEFRFELMSVLENDIISNLSAMFDKKTLKRDGYDGKWAFYPDQLKAELMSPDLEKSILASPGFRDESALVGNGFVRRNPKERELYRTGTIYQTVPGKFASDGAKQKILVDLAADKTRTFELMKLYGDEKLYIKLAKKGWNDAAQREDLIAKTVVYLRSFGPSSVFSVDSMFWDAVPLLFAKAREQKPKSLVTKLITLPFFSKMLKLTFYPPDQQARMSQDYIEVLSRLSRDNGKGHSAPVFLGRLVDEPGKMIRDRGLEPEFGALIGSFIEVFTGRDFSAEITEQLKKTSFAARQSKIQKLWQVTPFLDSSVPKIDGENEGNDGTEEPDLDPKDLSSEEVSRIDQAIARAEKIERDYLSQEGAQALPPGTKPMLPWIVRGAINAAVLDALGDLPLLIDSADWAFSTQNRSARAAGADTSNNVQLINVDEFYRNFHVIVNPYTMHPSVKGAGMMADLVGESLCTSVGPNP